MLQQITQTTNKMKDHTTMDGSSIFLTGTILFANMDVTGLDEYAFKTIVGGVIWFLLKISADYVSEKIKNRNK